MANAMGRPIAPLVLSPDERAYLERRFVAIARRGLCPNAAVLSSDARMAYPANPLRANSASVSTPSASGVDAF